MSDDFGYKPLKYQLISCVGPFVDFFLPSWSRHWAKPELHLDLNWTLDRSHKPLGNTCTKEQEWLERPELKNLDLVEPDVMFLTVE